MRSISWTRTRLTTAAILTLALGIGAITSMFSVVSAVMLDPLPLEDPGRLVRLYESSPLEISSSFRFPCRTIAIGDRLRVRSRVLRRTSANAR